MHSAGRLSLMRPSWSCHALAKPVDPRLRAMGASRLGGDGSQPSHRSGFRAGDGGVRTSGVALASRLPAANAGRDRGAMAARLSRQEASAHRFGRCDDGVRRDSHAVSVARQRRSWSVLSDDGVRPSDRGSCRRALRGARVSSDAGRLRVSRGDACFAIARRRSGAGSSQEREVSEQTSSEQTSSEQTQ